MADPHALKRRVHQRYPVDLPVVIVVADQRVDARATNLSLGGARVACSTSIAFGSEVRLRLRPPALNDDIEIVTTVRWVEPGFLGLQFGILRAREVWALNQLFAQFA